jgi:hypothetical protein
MVDILVDGLVAYPLVRQVLAYPPGNKFWRQRLVKLGPDISLDGSVL